MPRRPFCPSPPLGLTVIPPLRPFLALTELTTSTTSTCGSFLATSSPPSCTSAAGTSLPLRDLAAPARFSVEPPSPHLPSSIPTTPEPAGDHPRRNLIAAVAVPRFKPARDPIGDLLFFLRSSLQNISTHPQFKSASFENL
jgi:hypothetical protein